MSVKLVISTEIELNGVDHVPDDVLEFIEEVRDEQQAEMVDRLTRYLRQHSHDPEDDYDRAMTIL